MNGFIVATCLYGGAVLAFCGFVAFAFIGLIPAVIYVIRNPARNLRP